MELKLCQVIRYFFFFLMVLTIKFFHIRKHMNLVLIFSCTCSMESGSYDSEKIFGDFLIFYLFCFVWFYSYTYLKQKCFKSVSVLCWLDFWLCLFSTRKTVGTLLASLCLERFLSHSIQQSIEMWNMKFGWSLSKVS